MRDRLALVIWESRYWKVDLLRLADRLHRVRTRAPPLSARTDIAVEKAVFLGAFVTRRLIESHKLTDATASMRLRVTQVPTKGRGVTLLNWHRVDELFDFSRATRCRKPLLFLCNQAIHSYLLVPFLNGRGTRLSGVYVASDFERNKALFAVPLAELERAFRRAGNDYPTRMNFHMKGEDYKVTASRGVRSRR